VSELLRLEGIRVRDGEHVLLAVDHLEVEEGETLAVLGPTGAGKSTLLRVMNALQAPDAGRVSWRGKSVPVPAPLELRRRMAMVFQDPLLFRGTVSDNVAFGLRLRGEGGDTLRAKVSEALRQLGIEALARRSAHTLSGGEAQRTSLARAIVLRPELLLLDEPLASLDPLTRERLRGELGRIVHQGKLTCVHVTHDQDEAQWLADRIAVVIDGKLLQLGSPDEIFCRPCNLAVARFVRTRNLLEGSVRQTDGDQICVALGEHRIEARSAATALAVGQAVVVCVRAEQVQLEPRLGAEAAANRFVGRISGVRTLGSFAEITVDCGFRLTALITRRLAGELGLSEEKQIGVCFEPSAVHLVPAAERE